MNFALIGGDSRSVYLSRLLADDGHKVHSFALDKAELPQEVVKCGCLQGAMYGADCILLPTPVEKGGMLNAPYALQPCRTESVVAALWPGQKLFGGALSEELRLAAAAEGAMTSDIMQRGDFCAANAAITAECAVAELIMQSPRTLWRSKVLVCGWGRIGKLLAPRLRALGAEVTVAARSDADRTMAEAAGCGSMDIAALESVADYEFIVNTVPARIFSEAALRRMAEGILLMELASAPGGFDKALAENIGIKTLSAPGLPGKLAPLTAAEFMRDAIYDILRQGEEQ